MLKIFIILILTPLTILANGGGYHVGTKFTGSVTPFQPSGTEHIQIMDEDLKVVLGKQSANVNIRYILKNHSDKKQRVTFGFPVEEIHRPFPSFQTEKKKLSKDKLSYCHDYQVILNGEAQKHVYQTEKTRTHKAFQDIEGWMVSTVKIKANSTVELKISYQSDYDQSGYFVSNDSSIASPLFHYRLSTGAVWHGSIAKGKITITTAPQVAFEPVRIKKPVNTFKKIDQSWVWEFEKLEPTLAHDFTVEVARPVSTYSYHGEDPQIFGYQKIDDQWSLLHSKYEISASSTLPDEKQYSYNATNLTKWGDDHNCAWAEGAKGQGIGEHLDIKFKTPQKATEILIGNGYSWDDKLYQANSRIQKAELLINGKTKQKITLTDTPSDQSFQLNTKEPISTLRLTILSTYPGTQFEDTCLHRITFVTPLDKEPESYGAR